MICKNCRAEIPDDSRVCPWCAAELTAEAAAEDAAKTAEAAAQTPDAPDTPDGAPDTTDENAPKADAPDTAAASDGVDTPDAADTPAETEKADAADMPAETEKADAADMPAETEKADVADTSDTADTPDAPADADEDAAETDRPASDGEAETPKSNKSVAAIAVLSLLLVACLGCLAYLGIRSLQNKAAPDETTVTGAGDAEKVEDAFPDGFDYTAIDLSEYIELGDYKGITVSLTTSSEISESDIADYIENVLAQNTVTNEVDRPAENGDIVSIDFVGKIDDVAFDGGTGSTDDLVLGSGKMIPGFEEGIVGMRVGETKIVDATFPADYGKEELNGKTAQFEITVNSVGQKVKPEYNEAFVKEVLDYDSIEAYEAFVRETLTGQREQEIESEKQSAVLSQINDGATVLKYPEGLAENYAAQQIASAKSYAEMYGIDYETFVMQGIGIPAAAYEESVLEDAREYVKETMALFAIAKAEDLMPDDEARNAELQSFLAYYGYDDVGKMCEDYGITEKYIRNLVDTSIATNAALEFVIENATFIGAK